VTRGRGPDAKLGEHPGSFDDGRPMLKRLRIAVLLYVLLFVALGQFLETRRAKDWDTSLWVNVYLVNGSGSEATQAYIDSLQPDAFAGVEQFFERQSRAHGLELAEPVRLRIAASLENELPSIPNDRGMLAAITWSLRMRWYATRLQFGSDLPTPDITLFAIYHDAEAGVTLDRSTALQKGMIAVANLFGSHAARGTNQMIIAHEVLHTLGATDKYEPMTGVPAYPIGFADPGRTPLYPQSHAELMAGRVPIREGEATIAASLEQTVIGPATAHEIGWIHTPATSN
jgi:hypothetical protein